MAYQDKIDAGYMRNKTYCYRDSNGEEQISNTIRITPKGLVKLAQLMPGAIQPPAVHLAPEGTAPAPFAPAPEPAS
ncbi:phage antirepressor KilAC domain-containing protein [Brytella acorum]|uniref:Phage antirepressor KilAC domain-containing protein n=1 Tax=Brytella acorum TaxID=2959299 RepID=A0AA35V8C8_9PROT|nr:phage antirepressor KilAC domain-containing protein [Brytella acorum]CAI9121473.1 phage antirepressor KilAC domain-containing protein [Brytella acorum]